MLSIGFFEVTLIAAAFLTSLVAGLLFTFAVVVMPGIKRLDDREYIRAFQVMDGVIQNNQPLFVLVWLGSVLALLAASVSGFGQLDGVGRLSIIAAVLAYLLGVQLVTVVVNVPLNNRLQSVAADDATEVELSSARREFEPRWNRWNVTRTAIAAVVSVLLISMLTLF